TRRNYEHRDVPVHGSTERLADHPQERDVTRSDGQSRVKRWPRAMASLLSAGGSLRFMQGNRPRSIASDMSQYTVAKMENGTTRSAVTVAAACSVPAPRPR